MDTRIGAFGKLPLHGDFVRLGQGVPELAEFDAWLQEGIYRCQQAMGKTWNPTFDALPPSRFLDYSQATRALLIGVFVASQDRASRRYPFVLVARIPTVPAPLGYEHLPLGFHAFLDEAEQLATTGHEGTDLATFSQRVQQLRVHFDADRTQRDWQDYLTTHSREEIWESTLPGTDSSRRATLLKDLSDVMQPPFPPKLMLHLPSSCEAGEVGFWLGVVAKWVPRGTLPTLASWSRGDRRLRLVFDRLDGRYFEPVCWPERDNDYSYDLAHGHAPRPADVQMAVQRFGSLASGSGSLQEMQQSLGKLEAG